MSNPFMPAAKAAWGDDALDRGHKLIKDSGVVVGDRITAAWKYGTGAEIEVDSVMGVVLDISGHIMSIKPRNGEQVDVPIANLHPNHSGKITVQRKITPEEIAEHAAIIAEMEEEAESDAPVWDGFEESAAEIESREADVDAYQAAHQAELESNPFYNLIDPFGT